jgi:ApaG protein
MHTHTQTLTTNGIKVHVEVQFHDEPDSFEKGIFKFAYCITIENLSPFIVQLLRRQWVIFDSIGAIRHVEGEGVVGDQPVLMPGERYTYTSWCPLISPMGKMSGAYQFIRLPERDDFSVRIPEFYLVAPFAMN